MSAKLRSRVALAFAAIVLSVGVLAATPAFADARQTMTGDAVWRQLEEARSQAWWAWLKWASLIVAMRVLVFVFSRSQRRRPPKA